MTKKTSKKAPTPPAKTGKRQRRRVQTKVTQPSLTKQSFKDECNINNILGKYVKTGLPPRENTTPPQYGYVPSDSFQEAMNKMQNMRENFDKLHPRIRQRFNDDPAEFLEFTQNPENIAEMRSLGLLVESNTTGTPTHVKEGYDPLRASHANLETGQAPLRPNHDRIEAEKHASNDTPNPGE